MGTYLSASPAMLTHARSRVAAADQLLAEHIACPNCADVALCPPAAAALRLRRHWLEWIDAAMPWADTLTPGLGLVRPYVLGLVEEGSR